MAYIAGSWYATRKVLIWGDIGKEGEDPTEVLFQLNLAHILVPIFNVGSIVAD